MIILVTGGAGFIGSHFIEEVIKNRGLSKVIVLDNLTTGKVENLPDDNRVFFIHGDITNRNTIDLIFQEYEIDYIVHFAAISSVQASIDNPILSHKVNFDATLYLIEKARCSKSIKRLLYASSAAVYGDNPILPCSEDSMINPVSPYGIDKYSAERYIINSVRLYKVPATAFRFFNVYGPRQNPSSPYSGVISIFIDRILNDNGKIIIYGDGNQTRDFIFVTDVVKFMIFCLSHEKTIGEVYNVGVGCGVNLKEIVKVCGDVFGKKLNIQYANAREGDIRHSYSDISKLRSIGYSNPFLNIEEGIHILYKFMVQK